MLDSEALWELPKEESVEIVDYFAVVCYNLKRPGKKSQRSDNMEYIHAHFFFNREETSVNRGIFHNKCGKKTNKETYKQTNK